MSAEFIGPSPEELEKISTGSYISGVLPYIRQEIEAMTAAVRSRIFMAIRDGTFTPEMAEGAWREVYGYSRLVKRLETHIRVGQQVGGRVADHMTIGDFND
jgi:hypothetical protein